MKYTPQADRQTVNWILALLIAASFFVVFKGKAHALISRRSIAIGEVAVHQLQCNVYQCSTTIENKSNVPITLDIRGYKEGYTLFNKTLSLAAGAQKKFQSNFNRSADMERFKLAASLPVQKSLIREKTVILTPITVTISDVTISYESRQKKMKWQATFKNTSPFSLCDVGVYVKKLKKGQSPEAVGGTRNIDLSPDSQIQLKRAFPSSDTPMKLMLIVRDKSRHHVIVQKTVRYMPGKSQRRKSNIME